MGPIVIGPAQMQTTEAMSAENERSRGHQGGEMSLSCARGVARAHRWQGLPQTVNTPRHAHTYAPWLETAGPMVRPGKGLRCHGLLGHIAEDESRNIERRPWSTQPRNISPHLLDLRGIWPQQALQDGHKLLGCLCEQTQAIVRDVRDVPLFLAGHGARQNDRQPTGHGLRDRPWASLGNDEVRGLHQFGHVAHEAEEPHRHSQALLLLLQPRIQPTIAPGDHDQLRSYVRLRDGAHRFVDAASSFTTPDQEYHWHPGVEMQAYTLRCPIGHPQAKLRVNGHAQELYAFLRKTLSERELARLFRWDDAAVHIASDPAIMDAHQIGDDRDERHAHIQGAQGAQGRVVQERMNGDDHIWLHLAEQAHQATPQKWSGKTLSRLKAEGMVHHMVDLPVERRVIFDGWPVQVDPVSKWEAAAFCESVNDLDTIVGGELAHRCWRSQGIRR